MKLQQIQLQMEKFWNLSLSSQGEQDYTSITVQQPERNRPIFVLLGASHQSRMGYKAQQLLLSVKSKRYQDKKETQNFVRSDQIYYSTAYYHQLAPIMISVTKAFKGLGV